MKFKVPEIVPYLHSTNMLESIKPEAFEAIKPTYVSSSSYGPPLPQCKREFPLTVAQVAARARPAMRGIALAGPEGMDKICENKWITTSSAGTLQSKQWNDCAKDMFDQLCGNKTGPATPLAGLWEQTELLMKVAGSVIALDRDHFDDQGSFELFILRDRISTSGDLVNGEWHFDRTFYRSYAIRLERPAEYLDSLKISGADHQTCESVVAGLLKMAEEKNPGLNAEWEERIRTNNYDNNDIRELAEVLDVLRQPDEWDVIMFDKNTCHRSVPFSPGHSPRLSPSILYGIDIHPK